MEILKNSFRPQQGLTIMNPLRISHSAVEEVKGFRPQQGLPIMNNIFCYETVSFLAFPSPTGVNYYEYKLNSIYGMTVTNMFPSPTGVNYYE